MISYDYIRKERERQRERCTRLPELHNSIALPSGPILQDVPFTSALPPSSSDGANRTRTLDIDVLKNSRQSSFFLPEMGWITIPKWSLALGLITTL